MCDDDNKDESKLISIEGGNRPNVSKEGLRDMIANMATTLQFIEISAKMTRVKYNALIKEGFTESQALELCKSLFGES
jgi:hypothetical protein